MPQGRVLLRHITRHVGRHALETHLMGHEAQRVVDILKELLLAGAQSVEAIRARGRGAEAISGWSAERGRTAPPQTNHNQARQHHEPHMGQTLGLLALAAWTSSAHVAYSSDRAMNGSPLVDPI